MKDFEYTALSENIDSKKREEIREYLVREKRISNAFTVGRSILGKEITAYFIGKGHKRVAFFAAHHALEHITENILYLMISTLLYGECYGIDKELLLSRYTYCIIPAVNPDGIEMHLNGVEKSPLEERIMRMSGGDFSLWQANARGVDLNHNYDSGFLEYKKIEAERDICAGATLYSGEYPESEPETRAVASFIRSTELSLVVSLHTQGEEVYAMGGASAVRCGERLAKALGYKLGEPADTAMYGGLCDYTGSLGIPSFTVECGLGTNPLPISEVARIYRGIVRGLIKLPTLL